MSRPAGRQDSPERRAGSPPDRGRLLAISDLHAATAANRRIVDGLRPDHEDDWLIVAGDVAEIASDVAWVLETLSRCFATVIWAPGNHELWSLPHDPLRLRGEARHLHLVGICRDLGVCTPEDEYPVWPGPDGPVVIAPLFVLYDYSFRPRGARTLAEGLAIAREAGVVCADEYLLHPDPHPSRQAWCHARLQVTAGRLNAIDPDLPTVLVNHFPLIRQPTNLLRQPEFAQWCGTEQTADWHIRFRAEAVVYGHLHIPRTTYHGARFEEVSLGYPRDWSRRRAPFGPRQILPWP